METQIAVKEIDPALLNIGEMSSWKDMAITNDEEQSLATTRLGAISKRLKELKGQLDFLYKPIKDHIKGREDAAKKAAIIPLNDTDEKIRISLGSYMNKKRLEKEAADRKEREALVAKQKAEADKKIEAAAKIELSNPVAANDLMNRAIEQDRVAARISALPAAPRPQVKTETTAASMRVDWQYEIEDEAKIPREFLTADTKKLNEIKENYKTTPMIIPGVRFFEKTTPIIKPRC